MRIYLLVVLGVIVLGACATPKEIYQGYIPLKVENQTVSQRTISARDGDILATGVATAYGAIVTSDETIDLGPLRAGEKLAYARAYRSEGGFLCSMRASGLKSRNCFTDENDDGYLDTSWRSAEGLSPARLGAGFIQDRKELTEPVPYSLSDEPVMEPWDIGIRYSTDLFGKRFLSVVRKRDNGRYQRITNGVHSFNRGKTFPNIVNAYGLQLQILSDDNGVAEMTISGDINQTINRSTPPPNEYLVPAG